MPASTSVDLFLLRHGIAEQRCYGVDDSLRPLTEQGILRTMEVARRLRSLGFAADRLLSSPYLRAAQTAELAQQAGLAARVEFESGLLPGRDPWPLLEGLVGRCLLVGHEPDLTHLRWSQQKRSPAGRATLQVLLRPSVLLPCSA
ncbi:SixA phosphatase family protein [Prochlorococcus marinus]|uniref:SixA phosphatase family protein n=1 Tax=Prochlorococcus marinus TaxID=1219 RepID=UPI001F3E46AE|nr:histidine phosphatase family protein [Prochlorococcus marinus]